MKTTLFASAFIATTLSLAAADDPFGAQTFTGKVLETMNAATYTYVRVDTGKATNWAAAQQFSVKVGDTVTIKDGMPMPNYHSKTLNRDFDLVYFTGRAAVAGAADSGAAAKTTELPAGHPPIGAAAGAS
jgi:hypothetical protein